MIRHTHGKFCSGPLSIISNAAERMQTLISGTTSCRTLSSEFGPGAQIRDEGTTDEVVDVHEQYSRSDRGRGETKPEHQTAFKSMCAKAATLMIKPLELVGGVSCDEACYDLTWYVRHLEAADGPVTAVTTRTTTALAVTHLKQSLQLKLVDCYRDRHQSPTTVIR